ALVLAIVSYGLNLAGVYLLGLIINALASSFGSTPNPVQAMKLAVYASTASWIAGVFNLIPALGALTIIGGVYSLVLLFLGLPILMKTPEDKKIVYYVVVLIAGVVLAMIMMAVLGAIAVSFVASTAGIAALGRGY
ncbi:YIP1 family protein, partial [Lactiplantibacillus plantarum]|nr:YIP1 family protein [Lactiplantibacillus plantarum]